MSMPSLTTHWVLWLHLLAAFHSPLRFHMAFDPHLEVCVRYHTYEPLSLRIVLYIIKSTIPLVADDVRIRHPVRVLPRFAVFIRLMTPSSFPSVAFH
ncbi:hypothetical protein F5148DRAFT_590035 [Russula earlei]|uniref:Uncharacterized protein n=1 Tax=Russula earlei TaxID=71964 RepID=A0ACC0TWT5_9AGAM|nr:hypothetical protein F5148DRAFT_590035 [Russula earlei]